MVFCFVQKFFFGKHYNFFFCRAKRNFFFQNSTLGYMIKTLNQITFFFLHQNQNIFFSNIENQNIFLEKKNNSGKKNCALRDKKKNSNVVRKKISERSKKP
jgi:hypothetical protein